MYEVETQFDNNRKSKDRKIPRTQILFKTDQAFATCNVSSGNLNDAGRQDICSTLLTNREWK